VKNDPAQFSRVRRPTSRELALRPHNGPEAVTLGQIKRLLINIPQNRRIDTAADLSDPACGTSRSRRSSVPSANSNAYIAPTVIQFRKSEGSDPEPGVFLDPGTDPGADPRFRLHWWALTADPGKPPTLDAYEIPIFDPI
jgi:hypothetical protein